MEQMWRTEKYSVSPVNYSDQVTKEYETATKIQLHDVTLRDGEQQAGVAFSVDDKVLIAAELARIGVHRIEIGMPAASKVDEEAAKQIVKRGLNSEIFAFCRATADDIKLASDIGVDGVIIEIPSNEELIEFGYQWPKNKAMDAVVAAANLAYEKGLFVSLFLMDSSRLTPDAFVSKVNTIRALCHIDSCALVDTQGVLSTVAAKYYVKTAVNGLNMPVEGHFHNDLGLAVANSLAGYEAGASVLQTTVLGIGPRAGQAATEQVAIALKLLYGCDSGIKLDQLYELGKLVASASKFRYPVNQPVMGDMLYTIESGMPASWWRNIREEHPLALYGILPTVMGRGDIEIALGKSSGNASIKHWLEKCKITLKTDDSLPQILQAVKLKAIEKKGVLNEEEFVAIADKYV